MSGTSSIAMLSLTYTKEDRSVADQVYNNAFDWWLHEFDWWLCPLVFSSGTHMKTTQTRKNFWIPFSWKKNYYEGNINAPILENLIIAGRSRL